MTRTWRSRSADDRRPDSVWGGRAQAESPECTPGLLHVLHHPADDHLAGGVAHGVDVHLHRVLEEPVDQHRAVRGDPALPTERAADAGHGLDRLRPGARRRRRSPWPGRRGRRRAGPAPGSRPAGHRDRLGRRGGRATGGLGDAEPRAQVVPPLAVLGQVDRGRGGPEHQVLVDAGRQLQRRLAAQADDDPDQAAVAASTPPARPRCTLARSSGVRGSK